MVTVRLGTFETNSSSCHAFTIMNCSDWEDFKNRKVFIRADEYSEIKIHTTVIDSINEENRNDYFIDADTYYNDVYAEVSDYFDDPNNYSPYNRSNYSMSEFDEFVDEYIHKNLSIDLIKNILLNPSDEILHELEKPFFEDYSRYYSDDKDHIVEKSTITVGDAYDRIFGYGRSRFEFIDVYIYGERDWNPKDIKLKEFVSKDDNEVLLIEREIQD